ncbi:hypothetical protein [Limnobacter sp.]|uniref:hypothetical protein n=1 Tax=Limnobacter sp. TaxID=2003368 RepID=UPI002734D0CE|nr:hypothetical protein [Limnobacter sp.]MDP3187201.1 hypothetical protein [Limnobacter sp.]
MTPQTITRPTNAYVLLHELNKSQLNIGEVQISGLCSRCSALGKLLTQEITQHKSPIKKNKAKQLSKEINEISTAINKHLVQQLPLIKKQMQQSLDKMKAQENPFTTNTGMGQGQTYIKTTDLLQENIVQIDRQLDITMKRVLDVIPEAKQNELHKLLQALTIYQSTLCGTSLISTEFSRLSIFLGCLKSNIEMYMGGVSAEAEKAQLLEFSSMVDTLIEENKSVFESFKMQTINNLPIMNVFDSAQQKHQILGRQLTGGDTGNADIVLAIAQRHQAETAIKHGLTELQLIHGDQEVLSQDVMSYLEQIQLEDINLLTEELIQSEPVGVRAEPTMIKKTQKAGKAAVEQAIEPEASSRPNNNTNERVVEKSLATPFRAELSKLADWLSHDIKALNISTSDEKRKLGQIITEQLDNIYGQIDADKWPVEKVEIQQYKTDIEQRLSALEQLIAEAMAHNSPQPSPQPSPAIVIRKTPENIAVPNTQPLEQQKSTRQNLHAIPAQEATAQIAFIRHMPEPVTFDGQLQLAIQKLNLARTRMFDAYSIQEGFRQTLLESNQPNSIAWMNIHQTDMVLDYISQNIAIHPHALFVRPYLEQRLPMAEMIRCIQAERFHPHFDGQNCQAYLGQTSNWLDTFTPHFDYLDQLMSVTESMMTNKQRVA